jgi:hypothetical protein
MVAAGLFGVEGGRGNKREENPNQNFDDGFNHTP